jgi:hypothetical protein
MAVAFFVCFCPQRFSEEQRHLPVFITPFPTVCAFPASTVFLIRCDVVKEPLRFADGIRIQRVVRPFAFLSASDKAAFTQDFHVMGQGGLGHLEFLQNLAGAKLTAGEHIHNHGSLGIAQRLEYFCMFQILFHIGTSNL